METRFPGIDWFCDNCDAHLNNQQGFDDRKYIWKCKKCGYKNSISAANIRYENPIIHNALGFALGYLRSLFIYSISILILSEVVMEQNAFYISEYRLLPILAISYPVTISLSLFFERIIAKYGKHIPLGKWLVSTTFFYIFGDYFRPLQEVLGFPFALLHLIKLKIKGITFEKYFRKKCIYTAAYLFLLLLIVALFWKSELYSALA